MSDDELDRLIEDVTDPLLATAVLAVLVLFIVSVAWRVT